MTTALKGLGEGKYVGGSRTERDSTESYILMWRKKYSYTSQSWYQLHPLLKIHKILRQ